jgi:hypothetical protein
LSNIRAIKSRRMRWDVAYMTRDEKCMGNTSPVVREETVHGWKVIFKK